MTMTFQPVHTALTLRLGVVIAAMCVSVGLVAQEIEVKELKAALELTQQRLAKSEASLAQAKQERQALLAAVTKAKGDASVLRKAYAELALTLEARGGAAKGGQAVLEQKLLKAVRNYDLSQQEVEKLTAQLNRLAEAAVTAVNVENQATKDLLSAEVNVSTALVSSISAQRPLDGAGFDTSRVISLEPSIGLLVLGAGRESGARVGMPLEIMRDGRPVASATIVDVRDDISGAVLSVLNSATDSVQVGDTVRPQPQPF